MEGTTNVALNGATMVAAARVAMVATTATASGVEVVRAVEAVPKHSLLSTVDGSWRRQGPCSRLCGMCTWRR